jgi:hypothetical protein
MKINAREVAWGVSIGAVLAMIGIALLARFIPS